MKVTRSKEISRVMSDHEDSWSELITVVELQDKYGKKVAVAIEDNGLNLKYIDSGVYDEVAKWIEEGDDSAAMML